MTTALIDFLSGEDLDTSNRTFDAYLDANNQWWGQNHDHIQWAFPLPEGSKAQPHSPVADDAFYAAVKADSRLQARMIAMTGRYIQFLEQTQEWRRPRDHNHLRITRVIRCLHLCGLDDIAEKVFVYCNQQVRDIVPIETWRDYWREALYDEPSFLRGQE